MLFILLILLHLVSLKSFGVPYMAPISPSSLTDMKDTVIRVPLNYMFRRPSLIQTKNQRRRETGDSKAEEENSETKRDKP